VLGISGIYVANETRGRVGQRERGARAGDSSETRNAFERLCLAQWLRSQEATAVEDLAESESTPGEQEGDTLAKRRGRSRAKQVVSDDGGAAQKPRARLMRGKKAWKMSLILLVAI